MTLWQIGPILLVSGAETRNKHCYWIYEDVLDKKNGFKVFHEEHSFFPILFYFNISLRRTERSAISSNSDLAREFEHDSKWEDSFGGHDSGYIFKKHSEINNDRHGHYDAGKAENEEHAKILKSGGGKHAVAAAEGGIEKHSDGANARGKGKSHFANFFLIFIFSNYR